MAISRVCTRQARDGGLFLVCNSGMLGGGTSATLGAFY